MKLNDDFMRHFRWLTPLLLAFSVFMLGRIYFRFEKIEDSQIETRVDMAIVKVKLGLLDKK